MPIVNKELVKRYTSELKAANLKDNGITYINVLKIFNLVQAEVETDLLFYSPMMYYSVFILLRKAYLEDLIAFDQRNIYFKTKEVDLEEADLCFLHLTDTSFTTGNMEKARTIIEERGFEPSLQFYQSYNTFDSLKRRLKVMANSNDTDGKSVIFLGDDELYSVFYALNTNAKEIAVVDIDDRILSYIQHLNKLYHLNIKTYHANLLEGIPEELLAGFDVFFASGLKDLGGLMAFVSTGLVCLKEGEKKSGYFIYYEYEGDKMKIPYEQQLQKNLGDMNCYLEILVPCDEVKLPVNVVDETIRLLQAEMELGIGRKYQKHVKEALRKDNPMSADPNYPMFSMKPAKLAKISTSGLQTNVPRLVLKSLQNAYKKNNGKV